MLFEASVLQQRVARGAAFLDARMPNWHTTINLGSLDIASCRNCVLGQLGNQMCLSIKPVQYPMFFGFERMVLDLFSHLTREEREDAVPSHGFSLSIKDLQNNRLDRFSLAVRDNGATVDLHSVATEATQAYATMTGAWRTEILKRREPEQVTWTHRDSPCFVGQD